MRKLLKWIPFVLCATGFGWLIATTPDGIYIAPMGAIGTYVCQRLQADLIDFFGKNAAQYRTLGSSALIKWLLGPQNTKGFRQIDVESIPGKKRGVAFMVDDPYCYELCALTVLCDNADIVYVDPESREAVFDLTNPPFRHCDGNGDPVLLRFKEEDMMKYCTKDDETWIKNQIFRYLLRFEEALDQALTTLLATEIGRNGANELITNLPIFVKANNTTPGVSVLNPEAQWYMDQVYRDIGLDGNFGLIGGTLASKYAQFQKWVSANDAGVDMSKLPFDKPIVMYDRNFNVTFGQSDLIMMAPGATQLVTWNKYKGEKNRKVTNLYTKSTVTLPTTGLTVDYKWYYDYKCEEWVYEVFLHAELATVLKGGCGANLANVNGLVRLHDCGDVPLIPECAEVIP